MKNFIQSLLDLIYRKKCYFCGKSRYSVKMCPNCYEKLEFGNYLANRIISGVDVYCAGIYTKDLQKLIRGLKYHNQRDLAYYQAKFMQEYFKKIEILQNIDFEVIPVPQHSNRIKSRKYNHMDLVCGEFAKLMGFECNLELIKRVKDTKPQYKLSRQERLKNLDEAFKVDSARISGKPVLIMDDICTTGTTFEEIIKVLRDIGVKHIVCFATASAR